MEKPIEPKPIKKFHLLRELGELNSIVKAFSVPFELKISINQINLVLKEKAPAAFEFSELRLLEDKLISKGLQFGTLSLWGIDQVTIRIINCQDNHLYLDVDPEKAKLDEFLNKDQTNLKKAFS